MVLDTLSLFLLTHRVIKDMVRLERKIDQSISRLEERINFLIPDHGSHLANDDVESISSSLSLLSNRMRFLSAGRETELLRYKVKTLEGENVELKRQVEQLQRAMGIITVAQNGICDTQVAGSSTSLISFTLSEDDDVVQEGKDYVEG